MPTQYAVVSVAEPERHVHVLPTGAEAAAIARSLGTDTTRYRVVPITTPDDPTEPSWQQREQARFDSGQYTPVPWASEPWAIREHYAHVAQGDAAMVAFTESDERGAADRQMRMSPGRYLQRYHGDQSPFLSASKIRTWTARWSVSHEGLVVRFATTERDIERVYRNGPESCMSHTARHYASGIHPTRVYAAGDLAIAYIERDGRVMARCVCWPERRIFGRIYDGGEGRLRALLEADGYRVGDGSADWDGARLLLRRSRGYRNRIVLPYLDNPNYAVRLDLEEGCLRIDAGCLRIDADGNIDGRIINGVSYAPGLPEDWEPTTATTRATTAWPENGPRVEEVTDYATTGETGRQYLNQLVMLANLWGIQSIYVNGTYRRIRERNTPPTGASGSNMITALRTRLQLERANRP